MLVLKILGNDTMAEHAELITSQVPSSLLPGLGDADTPAVSEETVPVKNDEPGSTSDSNPDVAFSESSRQSTGATTTVTLDAQVSKLPVEIDWDAVTTLPEATQVRTSTAAAARSRSIVLTGVNGLLRRHLLCTCSKIHSPRRLCVSSNAI
jgi:hypothetical protein